MLQISSKGSLLPRQGDAGIPRPTCWQQNSLQWNPGSVLTHSASPEQGGSWDLPLLLLSRTGSSKSQSQPGAGVDGSRGNAPGDPSRGRSPRRVLQTAGTSSSMKRHFKKTKTEFNSAGQVQRLTSSCWGTAISSTVTQGCSLWAQLKPAWVVLHWWELPWDPHTVTPLTRASSLGCSSPSDARPGSALSGKEAEHTNHKLATEWDWRYRRHTPVQTPGKLCQPQVLIWCLFKQFEFLKTKKKVCTNLYTQAPALLFLRGRMRMEIRAMPQKMQTNYTGLLIDLMHFTACVVLPRKKSPTLKPCFYEAVLAAIHFPKSLKEYLICLCWEELRTFAAACSTPTTKAQPAPSLGSPGHSGVLAGGSQPSARSSPITLTRSAAVGDCRREGAGREPPILTKYSLSLKKYLRVWVQKC